MPIAHYPCILIKQTKIDGTDIEVSKEFLNLKKINASKMNPF